MDKYCVYTCLIGDYETLNDQPISKFSNVPFICFTDNKNIKSETWDIRYINTRFTLDYVRSQRQYKILPHLFLHDFNKSIYIDNNICLIKSPEKIFDEFRDYEMCLFEHSTRNNVSDEFFEVLKFGLDDNNRIFEQINHYSLINSNILLQKPYWCGFLIRNHLDTNVRTAMEMWYEHVLRYSRRDQLSINYVLDNFKINLFKIEENNDFSSFHKHFQKIKRNSINSIPNKYAILENIKNIKIEEDHINLLSNLHKLPKYLRFLLRKNNNYFSFLKK